MKLTTPVARESWLCTLLLCHRAPAQAGAARGASVAAAPHGRRCWFWTLADTGQRARAATWTLVMHCTAAAGVWAPCTWQGEGGAAAATAQLLHPRCGSPPRSPDRRNVDGTQLHAHARHASSRSAAPGSPVDARHRAPFPDACLPHQTLTVLRGAVWQRGARQGKDGVPRCMPCDASAACTTPCDVARPPSAAAPGWGLLTPAAGLITLQPTPLPFVHRRWRLLMPSHGAGPDPPLHPQPPQPSRCRPSCWRACLSCCPGTCST